MAIQRSNKKKAMKELGRMKENKQKRALTGALVVFFVASLFLLGFYPLRDSIIFLENKKSIALPNDWQVNETEIQQHLEQQLGFGYRIPGSNASERLRNYIKGIAQGSVIFQNFTYMSTPIVNIEIRIGNQTSPNLLIFGAHYDTRKIATNDEIPDPVPGANDGASGVAGLLAMMNTIVENPYFLDLLEAFEIRFVFFDAEDQGGIDGWNWTRGSTYYAENMTSGDVNRSVAMILLDMVGDRNLNLKKERNSDPDYRDKIWEVAANIGYSEYFIDRLGYSLIDDHVPFLNRGIPSVDLIDFDYSEWHKVTDDLAHVSASSIAIVANTVLAWLLAEFLEIQVWNLSSNQVSSPPFHSSEVFESPAESSSEGRITIEFFTAPLMLLVVFLFKRRYRI